MAFLAYRELGSLSPLVGYLVGGAIIAFAWVNYSREWKKNADGLWIEQEGKDVPFSDGREASRVLGTQCNQPFQKAA